MQNNIPAGNWKMAGVLGLADEIVENVCSKVEKGFVVPANYNCPGQVIVSGDEEGIEEFSKLAKEDLAKQVKKQVVLDIYVRVQKNWRNSPSILKMLGYEVND